MRNKLTWVRCTLFTTIRAVNISLLITVLFLLIGCNQEEKYTVEIESTGTDLSGKSKTETEREEISAGSDSAAYLKGATSYIISLKVYETHGTSYSRQPVGFKVFDKKGVSLENKISEHLRTKLIQDATNLVYGPESPQLEFKRSKDSFAAINQKIAYGELTFGMLKKDFEKVKNGDTEWRQEIGTHNYYTDFHFDDSNRLYMVELEGLSQSALYIDTKIQEEVDNMVNVLTKKFTYHHPQYLGPISILKLNPGYISWSHQWKIGNKNIKVGVSEDASGGEYKSICRIYDEVLYANQTEREKAKEEKAQSSGSNKF